MAPFLKESVSFVLKIIWKKSIVITSGCQKVIYFTQQEIKDGSFQQQNLCCQKLLELPFFLGILLSRVKGNHKKPHTLAESMYTEKVKSFEHFLG